MKSTEKVKDALDRAESFADNPEAPPGVRMAAGMLSMGRGQLEALFPANDEELDQVLEKGAKWMWSLRSDEDD